MQSNFFDIEYSIVIPVYNSDKSLPELVSRIETTFSKHIKEPFEIIFIDDASPNNKTWIILSELAKTHSFVSSILLRRNVGKHKALLCGFQNVNGNYVITMDDDLEHEPENIPKLIRKKEHDIIIGVPKELYVSKSRKWQSVIKNILESILLLKPWKLINGPFKMLKREITDNMTLHSNKTTYLPALYHRITKDLINVEINGAPRKYGKSKFDKKKRLRLLLSLIFSRPFLLIFIIEIILCTTLYFNLDQYRLVFIVFASLLIMVLAILINKFYFGKSRIGNNESFHIDIKIC